MSHWSLVAAAVAVFSLSFDAEACSCGLGPSLGEALPEDGASEVPTNVVPWLSMAGTVRLLDADGAEVPVKIESAYNPVAGCDQFVELIPLKNLSANTKYTVMIEGDDEGSDAPVSYSFTTGDGPLAEAELPVPPVEAGFFDAQNYMSTCIYAQTQSCIAGDYEGLLELRTFEDGKETRRYVDSFHEGILAYGGFEAKEFCVELRARDLAGRRSYGASFCTSTESLYVLPAKEGQWDPACTSDLVEELNAENGVGGLAGISSGCSIGKGPLRSNTWPGLLVTLLGGLLVGRRRRGLVHFQGRNA